MLEIRYTTKFKKDYKTVIRRGCNPKLLEGVLELICNEMPLPPKLKDHALIGSYEGCRECHVAPDWLLIYEINGSELILYLTRTGTHSDLFD